MTRMFYMEYKGLGLNATLIESDEDGGRMYELERLTADGGTEEISDIFTIRALNEIVNAAIRESEND